MMDVGVDTGLGVLYTTRCVDDRDHNDAVVDVRFGRGTRTRRHVI